MILGCQLLDLVAPLAEGLIAKIGMYLFRLKTRHDPRLVRPKRPSAGTNRAGWRHVWTAQIHDDVFGP